MNHYRELLPLLNPGGGLILSAAPYRKPATGDRAGFQIDLLLQMRNAVELVEVKRKSSIDESVEEDVEKKIARLSFRGRKSIRTALVYDGELSPSVRENGYFDAIIPIRRILGMGDLCYNTRR